MKLYSSMRTLPVTNNAKGQQREITLKLGLQQSTEAYFPYIAYAANIEASKFFVCFCG